MNQSGTARTICADCQTTIEFPAAESGAVRVCPTCSSVITLVASSAAGTNSLSRHNDPYREEFLAKKVPAGLLGMFLLGAFGSHKFYLGLNRGGMTMALVTIFSFVGGVLFIAPLVFVFLMAAIAFAEGVIYMTKSDDSFYDDYRNREQQWF